MGVIQAIVNDKVVKIQTMEITNLFPVDWYNIEQVVAGDGKVVNKRKEQKYPRSSGTYISAGGINNIGHESVSYGSLNNTLPNLTLNDLPDVNFKIIEKGATNLISLMPVLENNNSLTIDFSDNIYINIITSDINNDGSIYFILTGSNLNKSINITESNPFILQNLTYPSDHGYNYYENAGYYILEKNGEICGIASIRYSGNYIAPGNPIFSPGKYPINSVIISFCISDNFISFFSDIPIINDSNELGGISGDYTFGDGDFDRTSDLIEVPELPSMKATDCGFVTLYSPGKNTLLQFCQYLWSDNLWVAVQKWFSDPAEIIVGLGIVPVHVETDGTFYHKVGSVQFPVPMPLVKSQYQEFDCGELELKPFWGSALDYSPYTQVQIYLPYIGVRELNTDEIMGKRIGIKYHIDLYGGGIVAFVTVDDSVRYQYSGNCMQQIPVSGTNYSEMISNLVQLACVVGTGLAASGAGAQAIADKTAEDIGIAAAPYGNDEYVASAANWFDHGGRNKLINCTVATVMSNKPRVERTGTLGAVTGQMAIQTPFLIITRPEQSLPEDYKHYNGYPSNITSRLGDLSGYTEVENIRLNDIPATQPEIIEIYELLTKGVIL